jgi:hypothetical protein
MKPSAPTGVRTQHPRSSTLDRRVPVVTIDLTAETVATKLDELFLNRSRGGTERRPSPRQTIPEHTAAQFNQDMKKEFAAEIENIYKTRELLAQLDKKSKQKKQQDQNLLAQKAVQIANERVDATRREKLDNLTQSELSALGAFRLDQGHTQFLRVNDPERGALVAKDIICPCNGGSSVHYAYQLRPWVRVYLSRALTPFKINTPLING